MQIHCISLDCGSKPKDPKLLNPGIEPGISFWEETQPDRAASHSSYFT